MGSRDIYYKLNGQYHKIKQNDDFEEDPRLHPDVVVAESNNLMNYKKNQCFKSLLIDRSSWLVGLLVLQSLSSFILRKHEKLLIEHTSILQFLTMLVGAGGNAGNQASVRVIRGLATGSLNSTTIPFFLKTEAIMALCLSIILGISGFILAAVFQTEIAETVAITSSLFIIVLISIFAGSLLPFGMKRIGIDPAHSSTTIQVLMDIMGVMITCVISSIIMKSNFV